jgi:nucleoside-diphosphate-sugar epimerase
VYLSSIKAAHPVDAYGRAKADAERALLRIDGLETLILRPPLVYGPRVKANFLALMRAIERGWPLPLASIRNRRSLIYVGNLVDAIGRCLQGASRGKAYAVSDGAPVSTPELCRALGRALGRPARLWPFPPALLRLAPGLARLAESLVADDRAIRDQLGWRPPFSFEEGLQRTAAWFQGRGG